MKQNSQTEINWETPADFIQELDKFREFFLVHVFDTYYAYTRDIRFLRYPGQKVVLRHKERIEVPSKTNLLLFQSNPERYLLYQPLRITSKIVFAGNIVPLKHMKRFLGSYRESDGTVIFVKYL